MIENTTVITEETTRIFWESDAEMSDEKKVRFLMRDAMHKLFAGLIRNPPNAVAEYFNGGCDN